VGRVLGWMLPLADGANPAGDERMPEGFDHAHLRHRRAILHHRTILASGSNLTFESRLEFPSDLPNMVAGLQTAISRFVAEANDYPKPFAWLADPNKSIVAVRRGYQVLDSIH
jgi:hypothetical protein